MFDPLQPTLPPDEKGRISLPDGEQLAFSRWIPSAAAPASAEAGRTEQQLQRPGTPFPHPGSSGGGAGRKPLGRALLVMGPYATCAHFDPMAGRLRVIGYDVLTFDHRGVGGSTKADGPRNQTAEGLARDALALVDAVWGEDAPVHLYGCVAGGWGGGVGWGGVALCLAGGCAARRRMQACLLHADASHA